MIDLLQPYQRNAVRKLKNGSILLGGVGTGKTRTSLAYYHDIVCEGHCEEPFKKMKKPKDLYIITTAQNRDRFQWEKEMAFFLLCPDEDTLYKGLKIKVDSWNNIGKYTQIKNAFFIFDEQRLVSYGSWARSFIEIAKHNEWILLSATPGDVWMDYMTVFIAHGFYKNKRDFENRHVVYNRYTKYPSIQRYVDTGILSKHRRDILVIMERERNINKHWVDVPVSYDKYSVDYSSKMRWNMKENKPYKNASEFCAGIRRLTNEDPSRIEALIKIFEEHPKLIIFYNYNFELDILRDWIKEWGIDHAEWNGQHHQLVPNSERWVYLVQYNAGAEGWNCIETDTIAFYSLNYSHRIMAQAEGRVDRMNTPFQDLYYYRLVSKSPIDMMIKRALSRKGTFHESAFFKKYEPKEDLEIIGDFESEVRKLNQ